MNLDTYGKYSDLDTWLKNQPLNDVSDIKIYADYCAYFKVTTTKTKFTRTIRLLGYSRVSAWRNQHVVKIYRFTGIPSSNQKPCPTCKGTGIVTVNV